MASAAYLALGAFFALIGAVVLFARPTHRLNQAFAGFLVLRGASTATLGLLRGAPTAATADLLGRLTVWYSVAAAALLVVAASELFLPRRPIARRAVALLALVGAGGLLALHALAPGALFEGSQLRPSGAYAIVSAPLLEVFAGFVALLEAAFVALSARIVVSARESGITRRQAAMLGLAFSLAPLHVGAFFVGDAATAPDRLLVAAYAARALVSVAALALVALSLPRLVASLEGAPRRAALAALLAPAAIGLFDGAFGENPLVARLAPGYDTSAIVMRAAFAALAALALLRFGLAGLGDGARARLASLSRAALAASGALLAGGLVLALLGLSTASILAAPLVALAALLLSPAPFAERLARRILLAPDDPAEAAERGLRERGAGPSPEALLGRYQALRELGRGTSGATSLARDLAHDRLVVLKRFHARSSAAALAEARALEGLRHPRVVPLLEVERVGDEVFLVLGYIPGGTARDLLDREGPLTPARAVGLALDALEALSAIHAKGLVHRDVKPENLLLDAEGRGVLADLGSARSIDATATGSGAGVSLSTVAPEALRGDAAAPASDIYSVAATLHRLLTGRHHVALEDVDLFTARERILLDEPRLPDPRVPAVLEAVLRRGLAKRPGARFGSAGEMAEALRSSLALVHEQASAHAHDVAGREDAPLPLLQGDEVDAAGVARVG